MNKKLIRLTESDLHRIVKESVNRIVEGANDERFLPYLQKTYDRLETEYKNWQFATYKPQGIDDVIDAISAAMISVRDIIKKIESNDNIPTWEDPRPY